MTCTHPHNDHQHSVCGDDGSLLNGPDSTYSSPCVGSCELDRLRAVEKAAIAMTDKYRAPNFVNDEPCDLGSRYCRAHEAEFDEWAETCALGALRAALRGDK